MILDHALSLQLGALSVHRCLKRLLLFKVTSWPRKTKGVDLQICCEQCPTPSSTGQWLSMLFIVSVTAACSPIDHMDLESTADANKRDGILFHAADVIEDRWHHVQLSGATRYSVASFAGEVAIHAMGRDSASGLARRISVDTALCPEISWAWNVATLQESANLFGRDMEDVAASIYLIFGDPGLFTHPEPVPTLRYVWTTEHANEGAIIDSPYLEGVVKSLIVRTGDAEHEAWLIERRNLVEDFTAAYGFPPPDKIQAIILFTDNDQTKEPVEAYYGWARVHCLAEGIVVEEEIGWD